MNPGLPGAGPNTSLTATPHQFSKSKHSHCPYFSSESSQTPQLLNIYTPLFFQDGILGDIHGVSRRSSIIQALTRPTPTLPQQLLLHPALRATAFLHLSRRCYGSQQSATLTKTPVLASLHCRLGAKSNLIWVLLNNELNSSFSLSLSFFFSKAVLFSTAKRNPMKYFYLRSVRLNMKVSHLNSHQEDV